MLSWSLASVDKCHYIYDIVQVRGGDSSFEDFRWRSFTLFYWGIWSTLLILRVKLVELFLFRVDLVHQSCVVEHVVDLAVFTANLDASSDFNLWRHIHLPLLDRLFSALRHLESFVFRG